MYLIFLTGAPDAPENLQASDVHADHLKLSWLPPSDDGGAEITGQTLTYFILDLLHICADFFFCFKVEPFG